VLVEVLDVDDPEAAGAELGGLRSLTDRRIWRVCEDVARRTGSWNTIVLSVITASGRPNVSLRSKCTCNGRACCVRPAPSCGAGTTPTASSAARSAAGDLRRDSSSQNSGCRSSTDAHVVQIVAPLDRELARLLVLHLADR
jgi:hypothetical protein